MLNTLKDFFTLDMIYMFVNVGVIPCWLMLIFLPGWNGTKTLVNSVVIPLILGLAYTYVLYVYLNNSGITALKSSGITATLFSSTANKLRTFELYQGIDFLKSLLADKNILLLFWIHFLTMNLLIGTWISADASKNKALQYIAWLPLILSYFVGPLGFGVYLILRILAAQKLKLFD
jgi:Domain of unknown function (DUF4281)